MNVTCQGVPLFLKIGQPMSILSIDCADSIRRIYATGTYIDNHRTRFDKGIVNHAGSSHGRNQDIGFASHGGQIRSF